MPEHPYRIIIGGSRSGKTNTVLNLISHQTSIDKIYLYTTDPNEPKYQFLMKKMKVKG